MIALKRKAFSMKEELNFKLYKNNSLIISKNNVAYFKNFDKILFGIDKSKFFLILKENNIILEKEDEESIFHIELGSENNCNITLKNENVTFDIKIEKQSLKIYQKKVILEYLLETDDENTKIEIDL